MSEYVIAVPRGRRRKRRKPTFVEWVCIVWTFEIALMPFAWVFNLIHYRHGTGDWIALGLMAAMFCGFFYPTIHFVTWPIARRALRDWIIGVDE